MTSIIRKVVSKYKEKRILDKKAPIGIFSFRKWTYTSCYCIRVRRASDNAVKDIRFVNDYIDYKTLETFCAGTDGFLVIFYNQYGNGNNATQAVISSQPQIVNSGKFMSEGFYFDGYDDKVKITDYSEAQISKPQLSMYSKCLLGTDAGYIFCKNQLDSSDRQYAVYANISGGNRVNGVILNNTSLTNVFSLKDLNLIAIWKNAEANGVYEKTKLSAVRTTFSGTLTNKPDFYIGCRAPGNPGDGFLKMNFSSFLIGINDWESIYDEIFTYDNQPYILDLLNAEKTCVLDLSLFQTKSTYHGYCIKVRRSSDNAILDIGFVNGYIDIISLEDFCSGTDGYVHTWYNKYDLGNDAIQNIIGSQPKIVDSGNFIQDGIEFDDIDDFMDILDYSEIQITNSSFTFYANFKQTAGGYIFAKNGTSSAENQYSLYTDGTNLGCWMEGASRSSIVIGENNKAIYDWNANTGNIRFKEMILGNSSTGNVSSPLTNRNFCTIGARNNDLSGNRLWFFGGNIKSVLILKGNQYDEAEKIKGKV